MPTCPGCYHPVPYDELDLHERHCVGIRGATRLGTRPIERLESRIAAVEEHLDRRLLDLESEVDRKLADLEPDRRPPTRPE